MVIVNYEEEIANELVDYYFEGLVPMECVNLIQDSRKEPLFQLRWFSC